MAEDKKYLAELFGIRVDDVREPGPSIASAKQGRDAVASARLGGQCLEEGDFEGAIRHFQTAVEQAGEKDAAFRTDLAGVLETADREAEALRQYRKLERGSPTPEAAAGIADLYRRSGRFKTAVEELGKGIAANPQDPYLHHKLALTLLEAGHPSGAVAPAIRATQLDPENAFYFLWLGDLMIRLRRFDEALAHFRAALELSPGDDYYCLRASVAFWGAGRREDAVLALQVASELNAENALYPAMRETLRRELGNGSESEWRAAMDEMDGFDLDRWVRLCKEYEIDPPAIDGLDSSSESASG